MDSQLHRDLRLRTRERVTYLIRDTFDLYDMAGLSSTDAAQTLTEMLISALSSIVAQSDACPYEVGAFIVHRIEVAKKQLAAEDNR